MSNNNSLACTSALYRCEERLNLTNNKRAKISGTYYQQYKRFLRWFDANVNNPEYALSPEPNGAENIPIYCTQHNVEQYFKHAVSNYIGKSGAARSHFTTLQWVYYNVESQKGTNLICTPIINEAFRRQENFHRNASTDMHKTVDPHKGLRGLMPIDDTLKIVTGIHLHSADAPDLLFSYLWGINAGVRGASSRVLRFCDINVSFGYGPEAHPPRNCTLMLIYRTGDVHKDRHTTDKQVGAQRHRNYKLCSCFATGLLLIKRINSFGSRINFLSNGDKRPIWWDIPINRFTSLNEESNAMELIYNKTGVKNYKNTHHRSQCVQYAGSRGLTDGQISTVTKHRTEKIQVAYMPEAECQTLKVLSGFGKVCFIIFFLCVLLYISLIPNYFISPPLFLCDRMNIGLSMKNIVNLLVDTIIS